MKPEVAHTVCALQLGLVEGTVRVRLLPAHQFASSAAAAAFPLPLPFPPPPAPTASGSSVRRARHPQPHPQPRSSSTSRRRPTHEPRSTATRLRHTHTARRPHALLVEQSRCAARHELELRHVHTSLTRPCHPTPSWTLLRQIRRRSILVAATRNISHNRLRLSSSDSDRPTLSGATYSSTTCTPKRRQHRRRARIGRRRWRT